MTSFVRSGTRSTDVICDASVVIKWLHETDESETREARTLADEHEAGNVQLYILELTFYEVANVLIRSLRQPAAEVIDVLDELRGSVGVVALTQDELRSAARLAEEHRLTFYDASYAAAAQALDSILATVDRALITAGLGLTPSATLDWLAIHRA